MNMYAKCTEIRVRIALYGRNKTFLSSVYVGVALLFCLFALNPLSAQTEMKKDMEMEGGMKMEMATEGIFEGKGKIMAIVTDKEQVVLEHEEIKGFMKAMTMGYPVESKALLKGLEPGDAVKFKIDAAKKKIIAIERVKK